MSAELTKLLDERALRRLVDWYAQAADRRDAELFAAIVTADCVIEGTGFRLEGRDQIRGIPAMIASRFISTLHCVMNQCVTFDGDAARGETYTLAYHRYDTAEGQPMTLDWAIRYQDRYRREGGEWRIAYRQLIIDWERHTPVAPPAHVPGSATS